MHSWSYALCVTQFFKTLVGWRYQSILVCYILSFFIVCTVWLMLLTLWMLAVQNSQFFGSRMRVSLVGVGWCVYRILCSGILRTAFTTSVYG